LKEDHAIDLETLDRMWETEVITVLFTGSAECGTQFIITSSKPITGGAWNKVVNLLNSLNGHLLFEGDIRYGEERLKN